MSTEHDPRAASNPFIRYRERLDCYRQARDRGWSDARFVALVEQLDEAIRRVDGRGFSITPFVEAPALAGALQCGPRTLWIKDETGNVAGSHKARHLFGVLLDHAISNRTDGELAIASCGNAALAAAVLARGVDRPLRVFIPTWADHDVVARLDALGASVHVCERRDGERGDPTYLRLRDAVANGAVAFSCQSSMTPSTLDGGRTLGFELADQLANRAVGERLRLYVQVGGGALACATWSGLRDGLRRAASALQPTLHPVQTTACAPLARAWSLLGEAAGDTASVMSLARRTPERFMWPWEHVGTSRASGILDDVTYDWLPIVEAMVTTGGWTVTCEERSVLRAHELIHGHTGIDADATGTAGLAGVLHDLGHGRIGAGDDIVVLATGVTRSASR